MKSMDGLASGARKDRRWSDDKSGCRLKLSLDQAQVKTEDGLTTCADKDHR